MATSSGITVLLPFKIWAVLSLTAVFMLSWAAFEIVKIDSNKSEELVATQLEVLVNARYRDLASGRFRDFVEGVGSKYPNLFVSIEGEFSKFQFGSKVGKRVCTQKTIAVPESGEVKVAICRQSTLPVFPLAMLAIILICILVFGYIYTLQLEKAASLNLVNIFSTIGINVRQDGGIQGIFSRVQELTSELKAERSRAIELSKYEAMGHIAGQVAHDIRSPLAALKVLGKLSQRGEDFSLTFQKCVARLDGIVEELLKQYRPVLGSPLRQNTISVRFTRLSPIIAEIVQEKLLLWKNTRLDNILRVTDSIPTGVGTSLDASMFGRILSNILNNAAESMGKISESHPGSIHVEASLRLERIVIEVSDNGCGMSDEILEKVGTKGFTYGKENGTGVGLSHAFHHVKSLGGGQ